MAIEPTVACPKCQSVDVRAARMVGINDESVMTDWTGDFECGDCGFQTSRYEDLQPIPNVEIQRGVLKLSDLEQRIVVATVSGSSSARQVLTKAVASVRQ